MKRKILLIMSSFEDVSLSVSSHEEIAGRESDRLHYPLGTAYLHSTLQFHGNIVRELFLNNYSYDFCFEKTIQAIKEFSPDIVGLQMLTSNRVSSYRLIEYIHDNYPEIKIVIGGIHATILYEQIIEKYPYIIAVIGESERTFPELVTALYSPKGDISQVDGIAFYEGKRVIRTKNRERVKDLNTLPFPKHSPYFKGKRDFGSLITTRGCPFTCSFCVLKTFAERRVRARSVKNVIAEVEYLTEKIPQIKRIMILDETFLINNSRAIQFCDEIINKGIKINFICSARMKPLSKELVAKLEQANFKKILFGLESGNAEILRKSHKAITKDDTIQAFELFADSPIQIAAFLIVGLPGETMETIKETAQFVQQLQRIKYAHYTNMNVLTVYPGTEIYELAKRKGVLTDEFWLSDKPTPIFTGEHTEEQLFKFKKVLMDSLSVNRILTPDGFMAQAKMIPHIVKFILFGLKGAQATKQWKD